MGKLSFENLAKKLDKIGHAESDGIIIKFQIDEYELNIFRNGRTIIYGTKEEKVARSLFAKYVGA